MAEGVRAASKTDPSFPTNPLWVLQFPNLDEENLVTQEKVGPSRVTRKSDIIII